MTTKVVLCHPDLSHCGIYIFFFGQAGITSCLVVVVFDPVTTFTMPGPGGWECEQCCQCKDYVMILSHDPSVLSPSLPPSTFVLTLQFCFHSAAFY